MTKETLQCSIMKTCRVVLALLSRYAKMQPKRKIVKITDHPGSFLGCTRTHQKPVSCNLEARVQVFHSYGTLVGTWVRRLPAGSRVLQFDHRALSQPQLCKA